MGVFGAVLGRRGVVGFSGALLRASSGVVGFNVAMFLRAVREICRPASPGVGASAKKFSLQAKNGRKMLFSGVLGELFRGSTAGELLKALTVSVRMRVVSPCGCLSSAEEKLRMQFPSRYFKSRTSIVEILPFLACCGCGLCGNCMRLVRGGRVVPC